MPRTTKHYSFLETERDKVCTSNICGLLNKILQLKTIVSDTLSKIDIISLSETYINGPTDNDELYKLPSYTFIKNNRKNGLGGGVGLNKKVIITGDFNINYLSTATNLNLKRAFNNLGLTQIIKTATRITEDSSTSIDLIYTNKAADVTNESSLPLSFSDHEIIDCVRKINTIKYDLRTIKCRDYKHYNHNDRHNDI